MVHTVKGLDGSLLKEREWIVKERLQQPTNWASGTLFAIINFQMSIGLSVWQRKSNKLGALLPPAGGHAQSAGTLNLTRTPRTAVIIVTF